MASWKRFFTAPHPSMAPRTSTGMNSSSDAAYANFGANLKEIYTGPMNRLERYNQMDQLDRDPIVSAALNILAEFCTQENQFTKLPFYINYRDESNETETAILKETLFKWAYINEFRKRAFFIFRNLLKYGDCFFLRDPETYEWHYIDPRNIEKVVVDEANGKKIYSYFVRNVSLNLAQKVLQKDSASSIPMYTGNASSTHTNQNIGIGVAHEIRAHHIIHLSLNTGLDFLNWPFSASYLESIYKPAKQKELLENAYLIYKIQRAPERRAFYIYTGSQPSHMAMATLERMKNEMHQKRIPSRAGGTSTIDATYDPQTMLEDMWFSVNDDGQGSRVETLPGGEGLSSGVDDLLYFNNFIIKGLGIPSSYLPTGAEESGTPFNDGKVGVALLQEWRFAQSCIRIQNLVTDIFDYEFKLFCKKAGIVINSSDFTLEMEEPQSFSDYRQMEKDGTMFSVLQQAEGIPYLAKRFILKRFGGFTEEEITENEKLWKKENRGKVMGTVADLELNDFQDLSLNNVGVKREEDDSDDDGDEDETN